MRRILLTVMLALVPLSSDAGAFWGATVINASPSDPLNVRECASTRCAVQRTYTDGDSLSLTGTCRNTATGRRLSVTATKAFNRSLQAANVWCSIWHGVPDDDGEYVVGWARAKYLRVTLP